MDVTVEAPTARDLTPFEGVRAQGVMTSRSRPDELLVRFGVFALSVGWIQCIGVLRH